MYGPPSRPEPGPTRSAQLPHTWRSLRKIRRNLPFAKGQEKIISLDTGWIEMKFQHTRSEKKIYVV
jgi:hypothetical protein